ncbi:MAG: M56 family metallopeptidase [Lachnospiraceae bacterium]|nr:M56 family metallopeptidase [Lachnospiraceae bacterium]
MENILLSFIGISVQCSLVILVMLLLTPFLNRHYISNWKYWVWILLAARLVLPFNSGNAKDFINKVIQEESQGSMEYKNGITDSRKGQDWRTGRIVIEIPERMTTPVAAKYPEISSGITLLGLVVFIWIAGIIIFISVHLASYIYYRKQIAENGRVAEDQDILGQIQALGHELHIRHPIHAVIFKGTQSPFVTGIFKPVLVLPEEQYNKEQMYFILKHEMVHIKRRDIYIKLLLAAASAVHWFNPLVWIMCREAALDMELSCDEKVTRDAGFDVRKAYAEFLLEALSRQCERKNILSVRFYDEKEVMKMRFKNILVKGKKKYGICVLVCAVILAAGTGSQAICLAIQDNSRAVSARLVEKESQAAIKTKSVKTESIKTLEFTKEGETEKKKALLVAGDGYGIYLPDGEWTDSGSGKWVSKINEDVNLWVKSFKGGRRQAEKKLSKDGYKISKKQGIIKKKDGTVYKCRLYKSGKNIWGVFYSYPAEAEEGWGSELLVIADTFVVQ